MGLAYLGVSVYLATFGSAIRQVATRSAMDGIASNPKPQGINYFNPGLAFMEALTLFSFVITSSVDQSGFPN